MIVALNKLRFKSRSRSSSLLDQMRDTMLKQRLYIYFLNISFFLGLQLEQEPLICIYVPNSFFYTLNIVVKPDMKCKQGNSLNFRVKKDNFLQNTPKVNDKLIISVIILTLSLDKCSEYGGVYDDVKKSSEYIVDNAIVIKTGR